MALDIELYRRTIYAPIGTHATPLRRLSVIDIEPEGASSTLVFIHGYGGDASQWIYQLRYFGQFMRVIAPDWRGHGLSDDPPGVTYSMENLVNDVELLLKALHIQHPFYLIGHSFGGAIACEYILRHPDDVQGLVLIGVPTRFLLHPIVRRLMNVPDPLFSFLAKRLKIALHAPQRTLKRMHDSVMSVWRGDERMGLLRVPTLVILGQRDTVFLREHYEDVSRSIPGSQQVVIPVSAHLVQLERPDAVNRVIRRLITPKVIGGTSINPPAPLAHSPHIVRLFEMPWLHHYDSEVPEQVSLPKQPLHDLLTSAARAFPHRPAIIFFDQSVSYRELDALSNRFAHALQQLGVQKGDRVAIVLPNIPQCIIAFYGTLKAGAVVVLASPLANEEELDYELSNSGATVLLTLASSHESVKGLVNRAPTSSNGGTQSIVPSLSANTAIQHVIYTNSPVILSGSEGSPTMDREPERRRSKTARHQSALLLRLFSKLRVSMPHTHGVPSSILPFRRGRLIAPLPADAVLSQKRVSYHSFSYLLRCQPSSPLDSGITAGDLALLQYTSGTTDTPKGVMLTHRNLTVNVSQVRHWMPDARRGREVLLCVLPLSHSYGITDCMNLSIGLAASMVLLPTQTRTGELLDVIKRTHPTIFPGVPALYLAIANYPKVRSYGVASIRMCVSGSAPLPVEVQEAFEKLTRGRLIEGYGLTEASPVTHSNPLKGERRVGSIGMPLPSTDARVVDWKTGQPLPIGAVGELLIRGPQVMQGYWNMPEETALVLQDGWLHTGDLASMDEDGFFTIIDRKKDLILSGPYNVYPRDIEEVLYEHPKVLEVAVVYVPAPAPTAVTGSLTSSESPAILSEPPVILNESEGSQMVTGAKYDSETKNVGKARIDGPIIKAVVVLKRGEKVTAGELQALCTARLDAYKVPQQIEFRTELPKNAVGKVLRRLLVEPS